MFNPEQIEGSVWVLGYADEGEKYFVCRKLFENEGKQYAIMFSLFDSEIKELEKEDAGDSCSECSCGHDHDADLAECESCGSEDEDMERDLAVLRIVAGVDGEPDVTELTEEEDKQLEDKIEEILQLIDEEDEEEFDEDEEEDEE